jgi:short-subunit dehydrogenase
MGARLGITGRDARRTEDLAREIRAAGGGQVDVFVADLSAQAELRRLAEQIPFEDRCGQGHHLGPDPLVSTTAVG